MEVFRALPRYVDLMIVTRRVSQKTMAQELRQIVTLVRKRTVAVTFVDRFPAAETY